MLLCVSVHACMYVAFVILASCLNLSTAWSLGIPLITIEGMQQNRFLLYMYAIQRKIFPWRTSILLQVLQERSVLGQQAYILKYCLQHDACSVKHRGVHVAKRRELALRMLVHYKF